LPLNSLSFGFKLFRMMWSCSCLCRLWLIFKVLGFPFFAVVGVMSLWSRSMSFTLRLHSSIGLNPHSLLIVSFVARVFPDAEIIISSFSFVGILMFFGSGLYFGICHFI